MMKVRTLKFNEALHQYTDEENLEYTSVTTLIGKYHEQFDREHWSAVKAQESGLTQDQVKANWDAINKYACDKGNRVHKELEDSINKSTGAHPPNRVDYNPTGGISNVRDYFIVYNTANLNVLQATPLATKYPEIYKFLEKYILDGWSLYAERRVYWYEYLVAGTIDLPLVRGNDFIIVDWKTNKDELKFEAGYYKKIGGVKSNIWVPKKTYFYHPLSTLEYCKGNIYTMQLSLYAHLLELWGFRCVGLYLFHIRDNDRPRLYTISYIDWAAKVLCAHFKTGSPITKSTIVRNDDPNMFGIF